MDINDYKAWMEVRDKIRKVMGFEGRMISGSKSMYRNDNWDNLIVFNANAIAKIDGAWKKVWWGDIDITKSRQQVLELARLLNADIRILREMDGAYEEDLKVDRFVFEATLTGVENSLTAIRSYAKKRRQIEMQFIALSIW